MKGDLILRMMMSFFIPFLLLFGFFSLTIYNVVGFYSLALTLLYFLIVYFISFLRHKAITPKNLIIFKAIGKILLIIFILFLFYILLILLNLSSVIII